MMTSVFLLGALARHHHNPGRPYRPKTGEPFNFTCAGVTVHRDNVWFTYPSQMHYFVPDDLAHLATDAHCDAADAAHDLSNWEWKWPWTAMWNATDGTHYILLPCAELADYSRLRCCWHSAVSATRIPPTRAVAQNEPWRIEDCFEDKTVWP